jgi:hypothetical protein
MDRSTFDPIPSHDAFVAAVLGRPDPTSAAAFLAEILYQPDPTGTAAFAAAILGDHSPADGVELAAGTLREWNFDPDQPRDERGRWIAGGSGGTSTMATPPIGTKENGYDGLGTWTFSSEREATDLFTDPLKPKENNFPSGWLDVLRDGCKALSLFRIGWRGIRPINPLFLKGSQFFARQGSAEAQLAALSKAHPDKTFALFAAQLPTKGNGPQIAQSLGDGELDLLRMTGKLNLDLNRRADFNFATWFPTPTGKGYWEYMNHHWMTFDPKDLPAVKHRQDLPDLGREFLTVYGVVEKHPFTK